jgi:TfoX/Sxy family transcriptional regulator of competence genes
MAIHGSGDAPHLAQRIEQLLEREAVDAEAKKMFGGIAYMVKGHMCVGITNKGDLMVRFDPARHEEVSYWPGAKPMTYGKGGMKGFVFVEPEAVAQDDALAEWLHLALAHILTLPTKAAKKPAAKGSAKRSKGATRR